MAPGIALRYAVRKMLMFVHPAAGRGERRIRLHHAMRPSRTNVDHPLATLSPYRWYLCSTPVALWQPRRAEVHLLPSLRQMDVVPLSSCRDRKARSGGREFGAPLT